MADAGEDEEEEEESEEAGMGQSSTVEGSHGHHCICDSSSVSKECCEAVVVTESAPWSQGDEEEEECKQS